MKAKPPKQDDHAFLPPSGSNWWTRCTASVVRKEQAGPSKPTKWSLEGTLAHTHNAKILNAVLVLKATAKAVSKLFDEIEDDEMRECVSDYVDFIQRIEKNFTKGSKSFVRMIEQRVDFHDLNWGTLDYALVADKQPKGYLGDKPLLHAIVCDYKHGKGHAVSAKENLQLINYLLALQRKFKGTIHKFYVFIYQPRTPGKASDRWEITKEDLGKWEKHFDEKIKTALDTHAGKLEAHYLPGDHCTFCPGKVGCFGYTRHLQKDSLKILDGAKPVIPRVQDVPVEQLVKIWEKRHEIKKLLEDIGGFLLARGEAGKLPKGYKLIEGQKRRKWKKSTEKIADGLKRLGIKNPWQRKLKGITEIERELGKGNLKKFTELSTPSLQLVSIDDNREEITTDDRKLLSDLRS